MLPLDLTYPASLHEFNVQLLLHQSTRCTWVTDHFLRIKQSIFTVTTSLSLLALQTRNLINLVKHKLRDAVFSEWGHHRLQHYLGWTRQQVLKNSVGFCVHELPQLSSFPESNTSTGFNPCFSIPISCSQSYGCTSRLCPNTIQGPAQPLPWIKNKVFLTLLPGVLHHRQKGKSTYPYLIKINVTLNTTQRYYYLT